MGKKRVERRDRDGSLEARVCTINQDVGYGMCMTGAEARCALAVFECMQRVEAKRVEKLELLG